MNKFTDNTPDYCTYDICKECSCPKCCERVCEEVEKQIAEKGKTQK